jgi:hypothetical protein
MKTFVVVFVSIALGFASGSVFSTQMLGMDFCVLNPSNTTCENYIYPGANSDLVAICGPMKVVHLTNFWELTAIIRVCLAAASKGKGEDLI